MLAAGLIFLDDDLAVGRASDRTGATGHESENVRPVFAIAYYQVGDVG